MRSLLAGWQPIYLGPVELSCVGLLGGEKAQKPERKDKPGVKGLILPSDTQAS